MAVSSIPTCHIIFFRFWFSSFFSWLKRAWVGFCVHESEAISSVSAEQVPYFGRFECFVVLIEISQEIIHVGGWTFSTIEIGYWSINERRIESIGEIERAFWASRSSAVVAGRSRANLPWLFFFRGGEKYENKFILQFFLRKRVSKYKRHILIKKRRKSKTEKNNVACGDRTHDHWHLNFKW